MSGFAINAAGQLKNETAPLVRKPLAIGSKSPNPLGRKRRVRGVGGGSELR